MAKIYKISDITRNVDKVIQKYFGHLDILIEGEISNLTIYSYMIYFNLKDEQSNTISCIFPRKKINDCSFLKDGLKIVAKVNINIDKKRNQIKLDVLSIEQINGEGKYSYELNLLKQQLHKEGYFDEKYKKAIPEYANNIGVITSEKGDAIRDVLITLHKKCPLAQVSIYPTLVQGDKAPIQIIEQLKKADKQQHDVLLLVRGGGSYEDLICFNDKELCITIFHLKTPIISGVGHERDETLVDFVVDKRAATPTAAANLAVFDVNNTLEILNSMVIQLKNIYQNRYQLESDKIINYKNNYVFTKPDNYTRIFKKELSNIYLRFSRKHEQFSIIKNQLKQNKLDITKSAYEITSIYSDQLQQSLSKIKTSLNIAYQKSLFQQNQLQRLLDAYSPKKTIDRGFAVVKKNNKIIKSTNQLMIDDELDVTLKDGNITVKVSDIKHE